MSRTFNSALLSRALLALQLFGLLIFTTGFFLPAINMKDAGPELKPLLGWTCAQYTLFYAWHFGNWLNFDRYLFILSGWLNPIVVLYLSFSLTKKLAGTRLILVSAIAVCLGATAIFLFRAIALTALAGYYLWSSGAILIALPEVGRLLKTRST